MYPAVISCLFGERVPDGRDAAGPSPDRGSERSSLREGGTAGGRCSPLDWRGGQDRRAVFCEAGCVRPSQERVGGGSCGVAVSYTRASSCCSAAAGSKEHAVLAAFAVFAVRPPRGAKVRPGLSTQSEDGRPCPQATRGQITYPIGLVNSPAANRASIQRRPRSPKRCPNRDGWKLLIGSFLRGLSIGAEWFSSRR